MIHKGCSKCKKVLSIDCFNKNARSPDSYRPDCKECRRGIQRQFYQKNKDREKERNRNWYYRNKEKRLSSNKKWQADNKTNVKLSKTKYRQNNKEKISFYKAKRRAIELNALPMWVSKEEMVLIKQVYIKARKMSKQDGIQYHVDHIFPLQGNNVCGLHTLNNLQILTASENIRKKNKFI